MIFMDFRNVLVSNFLVFCPIVSQIWGMIPIIAGLQAISRIEELSGFEAAGEAEIKNAAAGWHQVAVAMARELPKSTLKILFFVWRKHIWLVVTGT